MELPQLQTHALIFPLIRLCPQHTTYLSSDYTHDVPATAYQRCACWRSGWGRRSACCVRRASRPTVRGTGRAPWTPSSQRTGVGRPPRHATVTAGGSAQPRSTRWSSGTRWQSLDSKVMTFLSCGLNRFIWWHKKYKLILRVHIKNTIIVEYVLVHSC